MAEIDILMAAYNGERFIAEQIESLLAQTFQDFRLIIRDDGSSDNTPAIIENYEQKYPGKIEIINDDVVCKSPTKNFMQLLKHAEADYVMFCDQDDVWLPYKVQITLDYMKRAEREKPDLPVLVFTGLNVVDAELKSLDIFMALGIPQDRLGMTQLLLANCASGCTEMLNRRLYEGIGGYSEYINIHDHWAALYAAGCGEIRNVPMALILYRQHSNNAIGAGIHTRKSSVRWGGGAGRLLRILSKVKLLVNPKEFLQWLYVSRQSFYKTSKPFKFFRSRYSSAMHPDKLQELDNFLKLWGDDRLERLAVFFRIGYPYTTKFLDKSKIFVKLLVY